ncbi:hypothetical protein AX774_g3716 [Zancudomyces culisetae]|uniref:Uncharacterized protein n=1 Tax=Zancudomyces culisetae TaxID=1213189 RepID=A0A1R1PPG5_ZANCU|nr:hypothetical protein AX774_g3716 [Zancudomyces culisetae]|eukprot:OMH82793.1 hypothetical protein AX774_g3716 [Zancudomyces culisetae]
MMSSVVQYSRAEELYSELNDRFKEKHPRLASYKLSMNIELSTVAMAMVYYEKLLLSQADFMPHLSRIFASLHQYDSPMDYLGPNMFYSIGSTPFVLKAHPRSDILSSYSASTVVDPYYNWAKTSISFDPF